MAFLRNLFRAVSVSAAIVLVAGISLAYANVDFDSFNDLTGPNSENRSFVEADRDIDVDLENDLDFDNDYDADVVTGENEVEENTEVGDIEGGDIDVSVSTFDGDFADFGFILPDIDLGDISVDAGNSITGPNSLNVNEVFADQDVDLRLDNRIDIDNDVDFDAVTGFNEIEENTIVGDVRSGDVSFDAEIGTGIGNVGGGFSTLDFGDLTAGEIDADFSNSTTGPRSENINSLEADTDVDVRLENEIDIDNDVDLDVDSGNNEVSENTLVGDIETGSVRVDVMAN